MPRVPTYDSFQATPNTLPSVALRSPDMPDAGAQAKEMGQALSNVGNTVGRVAIDLAQEANQLRVDDALNQAKEAAMRLTYDKDAGFSNVRGIDALKRDSGKPLADEYTENLQKQIGSIAGSLGNDAQRQAFAMRANDLTTGFRTTALRHEADQFREYALSVREGTVANRLNEIGLNYNNPAVVDEAVTSIKAAAYDQARLLGKSAEWAEAQTRKMTSNAHQVAISAALEKNDVTYAESYLNKYAKDMEADDILRVRGHITKEMDNRVAVSVATNTMQVFAPRLSTSEADRAFNIALNKESRMRQFDEDGKPLTSSAGAIGIAQVMPGTAPEAAKLAGLPWDENKYKNDATYNAALGRAYFNKQIQDFGGNLAMAYAAYNAGPRRLRAAIATAAKKGGEWLAELPEETQDYVTKNLNAYASGGGQYSKPTLQDVHNAVRQQLGTTSPQRVKLALDEATRQYDEASKAIKQREDEAVAGAMRAVIQNGGRFSDLPASIRAAIPPKEVDNILNFAQRVAKGDDTTNPALYQRLATDQGYLRGLSDNQFFALRRELNESDFKHFAKERSDLLSGKTGSSAQDLNTGAINQVLNDRLRTLSLDPTPKDGSSDAMRIGAMRKFVRESVLSAQAATGKKFTDAEVEKHIDGIFAKSQEFRTSFLGIPTGSSSQRLLTMKTGDIPSDVKEKLKTDFKAAGITEPTDADLLGAYWKLKFASGNKNTSGNGATGNW